MFDLVLISWSGGSIFFISEVVDIGCWTASYPETQKLVRWIMDYK
jgi:hypothetical protein